MQVKLVAKTEPVIEGVNNLEELVAYAARVSNPSNQLNNETADKLLGYCWKHKHVSIFETASMTMEIETSRAISAQILRHRSFTFQEHSQRYSKSLGFEDVELRRQDTKNRQNSTDDLKPEVKKELQADIDLFLGEAEDLYNVLLDYGVAKECARMILPLTTQTRLYMTGNLRSWITYCITRCEKGTQLEHRLIGNECWKILREQCPNIAKFVEDEYEYLKEI
jgi:thymidylate synthase (FAD)